ncbi:fatty-acyl reductase, partial [Danaus plexippus plexippus]
MELVRCLNGSQIYFALTDAIMLKTLNRCAVVKKYTRTISSKIQG